MNAVLPFESLDKLNSLFDAALSGEEVLDENFCVRAKFILIQARLDADEATKKIANMGVVQEEQRAAHREAMAKMVETIKHTSRMAETWRRKGAPSKTKPVKKRRGPLPHKS